ncbi:MAG: sensor histidine kinase [Marinospirillum sp.]|uniref:sensor histidine kinase n=1 Tax=Marinospirillum sp. TaxID=2183934 RepID=UPI0019EEB673|nr:sensor histidine kinase [Marinospirillum sp.]MBE0507694.1 sensor histidine kinase [Marinospirillum sp.]
MNRPSASKLIPKTLLLVLLLFSTLLQAQTLMRPVQDLAGQLLFFYDADNRLTLNDLLAKEQAFIPLDGDLNLGYQPGTAWLKFTLTNHYDRTYEGWLEVRPAHLDHVILYQPAGNKQWRVEIQGDNSRWAHRSVQHRTSVFELRLDAGETRTWYLQIQTTSNLAASLRIWEPEAMTRHLGREMLMMGGFLVAALLLALINAMQSVVMRERIYGIYAAYLMALALFLSMTEGIAHFLLAWDQPLRAEPWISLLHSLLILLTWWLLRDLVQLQRHYSRLDRWLWVFHGVLLFLGLMAIAGGWDAWLKPWLWQVFMLQVMFNLLLAIWLAVRGNRAARFYLLAFGPLMLAALVTIFGLLGLIELKFWNNALSIAGSLVHMLLMQLTVNDRVYAAKRAYEKARDEALNRALEEEQQAGLDQQQFLRRVAHEFRTPLAAIQSANELLSVTGGNNPELLSRSLEHQRQSLDKLTQLVDKALQLENFERLQWRRDVAQIECRPLVQKVLSQLKPLIQQRQTQVEQDISGSLAGDPQLLETLLLQLLDNALRHNPPGRTLRIDGQALPGLYRLMVWDNGLGIPVADQQRIFGKFQRGAEVTESGLGMGLHVAERIARLHGGQLLLESEPGQGSCFIVELPDVGPEQYKKRSEA